VIRAFIVGCPRSGTTYLQTLACAHGQLFSLPETHFFEDFRDRSRLDRVRSRHYLPLRRRRPDPTGLAVLSLEHDRRANSLVWRRGARAFCEQLDDLAGRAGAGGWIEKTPGHFRAIEVIKRQLPDARFVHVIRDGEAVVSSLLDVTRRHPEAWGGPRSIDRCVREWNDAVLVARECAPHPDHLVIRYEEALTWPDLAFGRLTAFLGLPPADYAGIDPGR
jgi:hypothetical protein